VKRRVDDRNDERSRGETSTHRPCDRRRIAEELRRETSPRGDRRDADCDDSRSLERSTRASDRCLACEREGDEEEDAERWPAPRRDQRHEREHAPDLVRPEVEL